MKQDRQHLYTVVDFLYVILGCVTAAIGSLAAATVLREQGVFAILEESDILLIYSEIGLGLAPLAVSLLVWRIWMYCQYRSYPPASDASLPHITVVIPAYNEGRQVLSTIRSVMASDYPRTKLRVICVDDGSKDDTWPWMQQGAEEFSGRILLLRQLQNMGKRHALLAGFRQTDFSGVFVTLDSDSEILPHTLRHLVSPLALDSKVGAVAGNVQVLNVKDGVIPKMLDVSFTLSFDFLRRGQSVYGGVLCTPGAMSAYRASVLAPELEAWAEQTFLGRPATIGEDRALSNIVLRRGWRVVYQHQAVVLTKVPVAYRGLYRMLLRWARSNVRECLVMTRFLYGNFRSHDTGGAWIRLAGSLELLFLPLGEMMKVGLFLAIVVHPLVSLPAITMSCALAAILPATVYQFRRFGLFGCVWALAYSFFWLIGLSWIAGWGLASAGCSGWLTRGDEPTSLPLMPTVKERPQEI